MMQAAANKPASSLNTLAVRNSIAFGILRVDQPASMSLLGSISPTARSGSNRPSLQRHPAQDVMYDNSTTPAPERISLIDISDLSAPSVLSNEIPPPGSYKNYALVPERNLLIAVGTSDILYCYDISDPLVETQIGNVVLQVGSDTTTRIQDAWDVVYDPISQHAFVTDLNTNGRLGIVDISDPTAPVFVDTLKEQDIRQNYTVALDPVGEYAFGSNVYSGNGYLFSVDYSNKSNLVYTDRILVPGWANMWALDIHVEQGLLFGFNLSGSENGFPHAVIFDISDPANLAEISTINVANFTGSGGGRYDPESKVLFMQGNRTNDGADTVVSYDTKNIASPQLIQFFPWD